MTRWTPKDTMHRDSRPFFDFRFPISDFRFSFAKKIVAREKIKSYLDA